MFSFLSLLYYWGFLNYYKKTIMTLLPVKKGIMLSPCGKCINKIKKDYNSETCPTPTCDARCTPDADDFGMCNYGTEKCYSCYYPDKNGGKPLNLKDQYRMACEKGKCKGATQSDPVGSDCGEKTPCAGTGGNFTDFSNIGIIQSRLQ